MADEIYEATFSSFRHQNASGFAIAQMTDKTMVLGQFAGELLEGISYSFAGYWKTDERFGKQFRAKSFKQTAIHTSHGVISYLQRHCNNVGPVLAQNLYDAFGTDAVKVLRTDPDLACSKVKRLRPAVAKAASDELKLQSKYESISIDLTDVFAGRGFSHGLVTECVRKWKLHAAEVLRRDPLKLLVEGFASCGWSRVFRLYCDMGLPLNRTKVQTISIWHGLRTDSSGSTWHCKSKAIDFLKAGIGAGTVLKPEKALRLGIRARWLSVKKDQNGDTWIAEHEKAMDEWRLAEKLKAMRLADTGPWLDCDSITGITEHQRAAAKVASSSNVGILGGPPGSGKSYTLAAMLKAALKKFDASEIAVCSPTGKASVRIAQALLDNGVSDISATTIHRLLKPTRNGHDGKKWGFHHGKDMRLPHRLCVIEEMSMLDTGLAADFFEAVRDDAIVMCVADVNQLPPVSHGKPLLDMIESNYPMGMLTEIHRNAGDIVRCSQECKAGKPFTPSTGSDWKNGQNVWIYQRSSQGQQLAALKAVYENAPEQFDRFRGMVTLSVTNESSDVARKGVNLLLQELLNPNGVKVGNTPFRIGDRAICLENGDATEIGCLACGPLGIDSVREFHGDFACLRCGSTIKKNEMEEGFLANGEMGTVIDSGGDGLHILFDYPQRVIRFVGEHHTRCDLGFCISTHRAQGSSFPLVVLMADDSVGAAMVSSRQLVLTAISRAEKLAIVIGKKSTVDGWIQVDAISNRRTFLREMLK